jgi:hypothetical protein
MVGGWCGVVLVSSSPPPPLRSARCAASSLARPFAARGVDRPAVPRSAIAVLTRVEV